LSDEYLIKLKSPRIIHGVGVFGCMDCSSSMKACFREWSVGA
jgi:hypothetical protein